MMADTYVNGSAKIIKIGSRDSELAKLQSNIVIDQLRKHDVSSKFKFDLVTMKTIGDQILDKPLAKTGEKNLFTRELESALHEGTIDMIVHSLKDLTTSLEEYFEIGAVMKRESPNDAVVLRKSLTISTESDYKSLNDFPDGFRIGTSSLRRTAQLSRKYPNLLFSSIRGNLNTRLRKLDQGDLYDAIILAEAGLDRLGWKPRVSFVLDPKIDDSCLYAVGQGALAIEIRKDDENIASIIRCLNHRETVLRCLAERSFLRLLDGGCSTPIGVTSSIEEVLTENSIENSWKMSLTGRVLSLNGEQIIESRRDCNYLKHEITSKGHNITSSGDEIDHKTAKLEFELTGFHKLLIDDLNSLMEASLLGQSLADDLLAQGAKKLLDDCKETIRNEVLNGKMNPQQTQNTKHNKLKSENAT
ncbi:porphobilinogen deaminase-like [Symsagittifera roscoffensis]|uniref:porphobilinogen deaminase-like n=1 Tax=Symsagittifera roscoffensis TaxID=84072 RepID=UPI00307C35C1